MAMYELRVTLPGPLGLEGETPPTAWVALLLSLAQAEVWLPRAPKVIYNRGSGPHWVSPCRPCSAWRALGGVATEAASPLVILCSGPVSNWAALGDSTDLAPICRATAMSSPHSPGSFHRHQWS